MAMMFPDLASSPFRLVGTLPLDPAKFRDARQTAGGAPRALVPFSGLETLWFNTGTLCNLACATCYIESSPTNDALVYLSAAEVVGFLDEIARERLATREIGLTGGEPFMNPEIAGILDACLDRGFELLVLTNAMRPMRRHETLLQTLQARYGNRLTLRVSLDHYERVAHEAERGRDTWDKAAAGLVWLTRHGLSVAVAGRRLGGETDAQARAGYAALFNALGIRLDAEDPGRLVMFPGMDQAADVAEISESCWSILGKQPASVMCASSRMVVKRRGETAPRVASCTLLPYARDFDMGATLQEASRPVRLNHPHCARFCVLGGASCTS